MAIKELAMSLAPGGKPDFPAIFDDTKTSQVSSWTNKYGKLQTAKLVVVLLEDLNSYFNVSRPMNVNQMVDLSIEIVSELWAYRMEEIVALMEAIKKQTYGKIYERLDPAIIWEHIDKHNEARENFFFFRATSHKQSDPILEDSTSELDRGLNTLAGKIGSIKDTFKLKKP